MRDLLYDCDVVLPLYKIYFSKHKTETSSKTVFIQSQAKCTHTHLHKDSLTASNPVIDLKILTEKIKEVMPPNDRSSIQIKCAEINALETKMLASTE